MGFLPQDIFSASYVVDKIGNFRDAAIVTHFRLGAGGGEPREGALAFDLREQCPHVRKWLHGGEKSLAIVSPLGLLSRAVN